MCRIKDIHAATTLDELEEKEDADYADVEEKDESAQTKKESLRLLAVDPEWEKPDEMWQWKWGEDRKTQREDEQNQEKKEQKDKTNRQNREDDEDRDETNRQNREDDSSDAFVKRGQVIQVGSLSGTRSGMSHTQPFSENPQKIDCA